ncbi:TetR family transcriptional regulator [Nocardioides aromaticivorans]|uniref:TetR family transcriptional regulator n=1 Tax=Nocardioides aromaticivorans TaxID=200618 RepID=A0ABX7PKH3_9ACTN|nr:TetR/AcrR family transcriptional regulator [Nocardioides aromaticivorans]QSR26479.1 TetR family transcriptional regulator [Nocardioides aromaticivorans]
MAEVKKRRYVSPLREGQAEASRAAVLAAARDLFVAQGYGATTIDQVAARAGVSKPTVFTAVGNKATLLKVVRDVALAGDDEPRTVTEREDVAAIAEAGDLERAIALTVGHIAEVNARAHAVHEVIRGASGTDPVIAGLWEEAEAQRHVGAGHLLSRLGATPTVPRRQAHDRLWLLMAPDHYHRLVVRRGWSREAYEQWLVDGVRALFAPGPS